MALENQLFQLKWTAKQLVRQSEKAEKTSKEMKVKCKKAMEKGNMEGAKIHAESAIREKNNAINLLRLSSRVDAVAQRVNTAIKMKNLSTGMNQIVNSMSKVMATMDAAKISAVMDKFEKQFEDLDMTSKFMENSIATSTSQSMPESEVDSLMSEVADEAGLEFESALDAAGNVKLDKDLVAAKDSKDEKKNDVKDKDELDLEERLKKLTES